MREEGRAVGVTSACGFREKNNDIRCHERWSAVQFVIPATCTMEISMSWCATRSHMHHERCIVVSSFADLFWIAATILLLSLSNLTSDQTSRGPQIPQLRTMDAISFAMIFTGCHSCGHFHWNHLLLKKAPQPHNPEASVCITA